MAKLTYNPHFQGQSGATEHYDEIETMQNALESSDKAKGDLLVYNGAADTYPQALSIGADGTFLKAVSSEALGQLWTAITESDISDLQHAITVRLNSGTNIGTQPRLNFVEGSNVTFSITEDPASNEIDITINASGGAGAAIGWWFIAASDSPQAVKDRADAVCDGTDDHVQINAALQTHMYVVCFEGEYDIGASIVIRSGGTLAGSGWNTILKANNITTGNGAVVTNETNAHNCTVRNLQIDGNYAAGGPCIGVRFTMSAAPSGLPMGGSPDSAHRCDNLLIVKCNGGGISLDSATGNNRSNWVIGCYMRENDVYNLLIDGSSDNMVAYCHFGGVDGDGIIAGGGNTYIWNCKQFFANGIGLSCSSSRVLVVGFSAQDNGTDGFSFTGANPYGLGLQADTNGRLSGGSGIVCSASGARLDFYSFDRKIGGGAARQDYGVELIGSPAYLKLDGVTEDNQTDHYTGTVGAGSLVAVVRHGNSIPWKVGY